MENCIGALHNHHQSIIINRGERRLYRHCGCAAQTCVDAFSRVAAPRGAAGVARFSHFPTRGDVGGLLQQRAHTTLPCLRAHNVCRAYPALPISKHFELCRLTALAEGTPLRFYRFKARRPSASSSIVTYLAGAVLLCVINHQSSRLSRCLPKTRTHTQKYAPLLHAHSMAQFLSPT